MHGYGQILRVDLTSGRVSREPIPMELIRRFLGGQGINDYLLWQHFLKADIHCGPLSPENVLILGMGPLLGTGFSLGSKTKFTFKGPAYRMFGDSVSGGALGPMLRWAGYDHLVITGKASKPVYLWIDDDRVEIRDAGHLWGLKTGEADAAIKKELGDKEVHTACCGPAGEKGVTFSSITVSCHRSAGRCGGGAVMGSKNLKAIVARGGKGIPVYDPKGFLAATEQMRSIQENMRGVDNWKNKGTISIIDGYQRIGSNAWRNTQRSIMPEEAHAVLNADWFNAHLKVHGLSCSPSCATACSGWYRIKGDESPAARSLAGEEFDKPEYLAVASFGMMCDVRDFPAVAHLHKMTAELGMDLMEAGNINAVLMELYEKGEITPGQVAEWAGKPLDLSWGNWETAAFVMESIANQSNKLGELFREGCYRGGLRLEEEHRVPALKYINYGKGGSMINEEVRPFPTWATNMAVATRGCDHLKGLSAMDKWGGKNLSMRWFGRPEAGERFTPTLKGAASFKAEALSALMNSFGFCVMSSGFGITNLPMELLCQAVYSLSGVKFEPEELWQIGERICNVEKAFNSRLGLTRKDDILCPRWMNEPVVDGPGAGMKAGDYIQHTLDEYYEFHGWDKSTGLQKRSTLERLGLEEVAQVLAREKALAPE